MLSSPWWHVPWVVAQVQGLGPNFLARLSVENMSKAPVYHVPVLLQYRPEIYEVETPITEVRAALLSIAPRRQKSVFPSPLRWPIRTAAIGAYSNMHCTHNSGVHLSPCGSEPPHAWFLLVRSHRACRVCEEADMQTTAVQREFVVLLLW